MPIILSGTSGIITPGITNTGPFIFEGPVTVPAGSASSPSVSFTGSTNTGLYLSATGAVSISTAGTQRVVADAAGNLGLGVTPSAWGSDTRALQIYNRTSLSDLQSITNLTNNAHWSGSNWVYRQTAAAGNYYIDGNSHFWRIAASGTAGNNITWTQAMTLNASGGLQCLNTVGVGNATPSTSGAGVTFPATQSASSNANTLDDYEEGTWTPRVADAGTGGNSNTTNASGIYTKIGNSVTVMGKIDPIVTTGLTSGNSIWIRDLPFANNSSVLTSVELVFSTVTYSGDGIQGYMSSSESTFRLNTYDSGAGPSFIQVSAFTSGTSWIYFNVTYLI